MTRSLAAVLVFVAAAGCERVPASRAAQNPTPRPTVDAMTLRTMMVDAESAEVSARSTLESLHRIGGAESFTVNQARRYRSELGHLREKTLEELKTFPRSPGVQPAKQHVEAALKATEEACSYLDGIIAKLEDPMAKDEIELASLRKMGVCDGNNELLRRERDRCRELEAKVTLKRYARPTP